MTTTAEQQWATKADVAEVRVDMAKMETGLRADMAKMETGLRADMATKQDVAELRGDLRDTNRRIDRMFYGMLVIGAGMIAAILAGDFLA